ncbi:MAG: carrier protein family protein [Acidobacteria bacterium]|jgi:AAA family ATP:ADP antiporter|nr:carrier protein family protein [Acidobacteriota bacterium]
MMQTPVEKTPGRTEEGHVAPRQKTLVERVLSPIADVRREEAAGALLMTLVMFLILAAYYELKTAREVFILSEGGAEVKSYSSAGQALLLLVLVPAYGAFASKVNRERLVTWVTLFFVANVLLFAAAYQAGLHIGVAYFLWVGIFNVMVIAQFWAFANDLFTPEQGKRIFPLIGVGSSLGAWVGSVRAGQLMGTAGPMRLLLAAAAILVVCTLLARIVSRVATRAEPRELVAAAAKPLGKEGGFELIRKDRYLMLIAIMTVLLNVVNTSGEYLFGRYVVEQAHAIHGTGADVAAAREQFIGETYSRLFSTVNLLGFLLQMFVVSRVFKYLGVGRALLIHPIVAGVGYLLMLRAPSIQLMNWLKVADNSIDYSLGNTTKQALWLPTSREAKYKAKQAVDSFFMRAGDVIQAGIVFAGERLAFAVPAFAAVNVVLVAAWLAVASLLRLSLHRKAEETRTAEL